VWQVIQAKKKPGYKPGGDNRDLCVMTSAKLALLFEGSQCAHADFHPDQLAVDHDLLLLDVRGEHTLGVPLRMAYAVPLGRSFSCDLTYPTHDKNLTSSKAAGLYHKITSPGKCLYYPGLQLLNFL
jgi:hypothetical protein